MKFENTKYSVNDIMFIGILNNAIHMLINGDPLIWSREDIAVAYL